MKEYTEQDIVGAYARTKDGRTGVISDVSGQDVYIEFEEGPEILTFNDLKFIGVKSEEE